jgi:hypothetical protein
VRWARVGAWRSSLIARCQDSVPLERAPRRAVVRSSSAEPARQAPAIGCHSCSFCRQDTFTCGMPLGYRRAIAPGSKGLTRECTYKVKEECRHIPLWGGLGGSLWEPRILAVTAHPASGAEVGALVGIEGLPGTTWHFVMGESGHGSPAWNMQAEWEVHSVTGSVASFHLSPTV